MVENQHRLISGYRDLTEDEIVAKNHIAAAEEEIAALWRRTRATVTQVVLSPPEVPGEQLPHDNSAVAHELHESHRQLALARTKFEEAFMHLSRAVLRPRNVWDGRNTQASATTTTGDSK